MTSWMADAGVADKQSSGHALALSPPPALSPGRRLGKLEPKLSR